MLSTIITTSLIAVLLLFCLFVALRDIHMLFRRPAKNLGTGLGRIWAVAHTTMLEAWAARVWIVPLLWLVVSVIILLAVRPFDESERIPLYIRVLLTAQEIILLLMVGVLGCISFPRERFHKIVITNASKPLSRLEMLLGKMTGFAVTALLLLVVMSALSWAILLIADGRIRATAAAEYALAENDFKAKSQQLKKALPPPLEKKRLAQEGSLFALNPITVPKAGMSIVGLTESTPAGLVRYIKGGSQEQIIYSFAPNLRGDLNADLGGPGQRPYFFFEFPIKFYSRNIPQKIAILVTAVRAKQRLRPQEKILFLDTAGRAYWEPDNVEDLFSFPGQRDNGEIELTVTCPTEGVFLQVRNGAPPGVAAPSSEYNVVAAPSRAAGTWDAPQSMPRVRGFERRDRQQIAGPSKKEIQEFGETAPVEVAIFRFPGKDLQRVPTDAKGHFKLAMTLDVDKETNQELDTTAWLQVYNENSPTERFDIDVPVIEKRASEVALPENLLGGPDRAKRGDLIVLLHCQTSGHWLSLLENSVRIEQPPTPFLLNLIKSELVILCEATLLVVICVACSVPLGWPVAMLTSATFFFLGSMRGFITDLQTLGGMGALGFPPIGVGGERSSSYLFVDHILAALWKMLEFIVAFTPDFTQFDFLASITQLRNMPNSALALDFAWTGLYAIPFIGLGYLFFRKQELG